MLQRVLLGGRSLKSVELVIVPDFIDKKGTVGDQPLLELHQHRQNLHFARVACLDLGDCLLELLLVDLEQAPKDQLVWL